MQVMFLGPPGAGKGTQAQRIANELEIPHISTGDMFRDAVKEETEMGKKAKSYMDAGELVPDEVVIGIVDDRLKQADAAAGFILDGFPRTRPQAEALTDLLAGLGRRLDAVINLQVPDEEVVRRLTGRRVCSECGATYHVEFDPPAEAGRCDQCGASLEQRNDDREETVRERLRVYEEQTEPLIDFYRQRQVLKNIRGDKSMDEVTESIREVLT